MDSYGEEARMCVAININGDEKLRNVNHVIEFDQKIPKYISLVPHNYTLY